jgi:hypothetical protein
MNEVIKRASSMLEDRVATGATDSHEVIFPLTAGDIEQAVEYAEPETFGAAAGYDVEKIIEIVRNRLDELWPDLVDDAMRIVQQEKELAELEKASGLYQLGGEGRQLCADCVLDTAGSNPEMRMSDWVEAGAAELEDYSCDACDAVPPAAKEVLSRRH